MHICILNSFIDQFGQREHWAGVSNNESEKRILFPKKKFNVWKISKLIFMSQLGPDKCHLHLNDNYFLVTLKKNKFVNALEF